MHAYTHARTLKHMHARSHMHTCAHGPCSKQGPSLSDPTMGRGGGQSPDTPVCGLSVWCTLETAQPRVEKAKTPELRSVSPRDLVPRSKLNPSGPLVGVFGNILESSRLASCLQNFLPSPAYELECPRGRGAHYIPGHSPQCQATQDIRRSLTCQPRELKRPPPTFYCSVPRSATTNEVNVPSTNLVSAAMRLICHGACTALL